MCPKDANVLDRDPSQCVHTRAPCSPLRSATRLTQGFSLPRRDKQTRRPMCTAPYQKSSPMRECRRSHQRTSRHSRRCHPWFEKQARKKKKVRSTWAHSHEKFGVSLALFNCSNCDSHLLTHITSLKLTQSCLKGHTHTPLSTSRG